MTVRTALACVIGVGLTVCVKQWASEPHDLSGPGLFQLRAERNTAPYDYWLDLDAGNPGGAYAGAVPVAASYPQMLFRPRRH